MPNSAGLNKTITAAGAANAISVHLGSPQSGPKPDTTVGILFYGTYAGVTIQVEGKTPDGQWVPVFCVDAATGAFNPGGTAFSLATNASKYLRVDATGFTDVRVWAEAFGTGMLNVNLFSDYFYNAPLMISQVTQTTVSGATTLTAASANALAVGANGVTNPVLNVDSSATSVATGWDMVGAAAGSAADLHVLSSGNNEVGTISSKGTSALKLNSTTAATGPVQIGGAAAGNNATGMTFTPNAAAFGFQMALVSTGAAENLKFDALGTGTIQIGSVSTGNVILGTAGHTLTLNNATGAVTLAAGGLTLTTGGITVTSGNLTLTLGNLGITAGTFTTAGGAASINASSNFNTVINTGTSTGTVGIGNSLAGALTIASGAASTLTITGGSWTMATTGANNIAINPGAGGAVTITPTTVAAGAQTLLVTPPNHTAVVAEVVDVQVAAHTTTITGAYATQREMVIGAKTFSGAFTVTTAVALQVNGSLPGTSTLTNTVGIDVPAWVTNGTTASAIRAAAPTGAANNWAVNALGAVAIAPVAIAGGGPSLVITPASDTAVTAEQVNVNVAAHTTAITGSYATQREMVIGAKTYSGAFTITTAIALQVNGSLPGNSTLTNTVGLDIPTWVTNGTTGSAIRVAAPSGAGTNWAINVTAGNVMFNTATINVTGTRIAQSYHTNITSTNAVTVDSWSRSKDLIQSYAKSALDVLKDVDVISFRHLLDRDPTGRVKLGVRAESIQEPLALVRADYGKGLGEGPALDTMGLLALCTKAIQELRQRVVELESGGAAA